MLFVNGNQRKIRGKREWEKPELFFPDPFHRQGLRWRAICALAQAN